MLAARFNLPASRAFRLVLLSLLVLVTAWPETGVGADQVGSAPTPAAAAAVPAFRQANRVAVLRVDGVIDRVTLMSLERRVQTAVSEGADAVVIDLNTPGGEISATLDICNLLKDRGETPANVVAWIHPTAYSAGTIIALACREIVVSPRATFGDAAPIVIGPLGNLNPLPPAERAKIEGPVIAELIDSARRNRYDENMVQAFARLTPGLWMLEHTGTGERVIATLEEYRAVFGADPPPQIGGGGPPLGATGRSRPRPWVDLSMQRSPEQSGMSAEDIAKEIEKAQTLPPARPPLNAADRGQWKLVRQVVDNTSLLTLKADEAIYYGLAAESIANDTELKSFFGAQEIVRYDQTWSESLVRFLISVPVKAILIVIFLVALFIELAMPGFGVFGATAAVALLILIGAPALVGMAQWWDILLIVLGLLFVLTEIFILPGMGVAGVAGVVCLLVGLVGTFISGDLGSVAGKTELWTGLLTTLTSVFAAGIGIWLISRQLHSLPLLNRMILNTELRDEAASPAESTLLEAMAPATVALEVGQTGVAATDLRPAGRAEFRGRLVDVKSAGSYIHRGTPIRIVSVGKFVIEVEELEP